jgi:hypothetical protein
MLRDARQHDPLDLADDVVRPLAIAKGIDTFGDEFAISEDGDPHLPGAGVDTKNGLGHWCWINEALPRNCALGATCSIRVRSGALQGEDAFDQPQKRLREGGELAAKAVETKGYRVKEIQEVVFLPRPVLAEVNPELGIAGGHDLGHLPLMCPAVPGETSADGSGWNHHELDPVRSNPSLEKTCHPMEPGEGSMAARPGGFQDDEPRTVKIKAFVDLTAQASEPRPQGKLSPRREDFGLAKPARRAQDRQAQATEARIDGKDGFSVFHCGG